MSSAQTMKIFSIINRIKQELEESPRSKFGGTNKRVVEVDRLLDLLEDLKVVIPEDIRRATGIISEAENTIADAKENAIEIVEQAHQEADTVLGQAQAQADGIRADAQAEFDHRVGESEVYKEAFTRASGIAAEAEENATAIYNGARKYADEILVDLQRYLAEYHQMIEANRKELGVDDVSAPAPAAVRAPAPEPQYAAQAQYMPAQPAYAEPPRYSEPAPAYAELPRQPRVAPHSGVERMAVEEDPTATRQFARPVSRPMPAEDMEEPPRRRDGALPRTRHARDLLVLVLRAGVERQVELDRPQGRQEVGALVADVMAGRRHLQREALGVGGGEDLVGVLAHEELAAHEGQKQHAHRRDLVEDPIDLGEAQLVLVGVVLLVAVHALVVAAIGDLEGHGHRQALALGASSEQIGGTLQWLHDVAPSEPVTAERVTGA